MRAIAALAFGMMALPAMAADEVAGQMTQCMSLLPEDIFVDSEIDMRVTLDDDGLVERIDVLGYLPNSPQGRRIAESAVRAVKNCQPYQAIGEVLVQLPADSSSDDIVVTFPDDTQ